MKLIKMDWRVKYLRIMFTCIASMKSVNLKLLVLPLAMIGVNAGISYLKELNKSIEYNETKSSN
jgi:hypothetical protein